MNVLMLLLLSWHPPYFRHLSWLVQMACISSFLARCCQALISIGLQSCYLTYFYFDGVNHLFSILIESEIDPIRGPSLQQLACRCRRYQPLLFPIQTSCEIMLVQVVLVKCIRLVRLRILINHYLVRPLLLFVSPATS